MDFIQKLFGAETKLPAGGKSAAEFLEYNGELINRVIQEITEPFLKPSPENETDLSYTLKLMDADTCGQMAFFLSKNMGEMIKTYDISGFGGPINTIAPGSRAITEANIQTPNGMVSRKQICDRLAAHYITILNLVGAILTAINPDTNMALARMNSLYTLVDGTTDKFLINICQPEGKQVVHTNILDEPGLREFLGLYLFHLLSVSESPADKDRVMQEYQNLVRKLVDEDRTVAMPLEIPESEATDQPVHESPAKNTNGVKNNDGMGTAAGAVGTAVGAVGTATAATAAVATGTINNNSMPKPNNNKTASPKNGIFDILTDKLSSGLDAILPANQQQQPGPAQQQLGYQSTTNNSISSTSYTSPSSTYTSSSSNRYYSDSERRQKQEEINNLANEINAKQQAGKLGNDPEVAALKTRIQNLIGELDAESSSSSYSSTDSSYRKWLSYKRRKYGSSYSSSTTNSRNQYGGTGTSSNNKPTSKQSTDKTINSQLSADASIARFINFMEQYIRENPGDKRTIMRNVLTLFKGGHFKKPDTDRIKKLCSNAQSEGKQITLQIDSNNQYLKAFNDNYLEMRHSYMKSVGELVDILENRILTQNPKTQKMELRNLTSRELTELETRTRAILAQLYSSAHTYYILGVNSLYDYYHNLTSGVGAY